MFLGDPVQGVGGVPGEAEEPDTDAGNRERLRVLVKSHVVDHFSPDYYSLREVWQTEPEPNLRRNLHGLRGDDKRPLRTHVERISEHDRLPVFDFFHLKFERSPGSLTAFVLH